MGAQVSASTDISAIYAADLILAVTSAVHAVIEPKHLKPGAVVCDVARPRDVSRRVAAERDDVLVIEGGMVEVPGEPDFHFDFGFPPRKAYACMAETMALALEGRYEDYTIGKDIHVSQAHEIDGIAERHGFRLSGFRTFEQPVSDEQIAAVRERAAHNRRGVFTLIRISERNIFDDYPREQALTRSKVGLKKRGTGKDRTEQPGAKLTHALVTFLFHGDVEAEGKTQYLMAYQDDAERDLRRLAAI